jgi:trehalose-6-phosphate synthase
MVNPYETGKVADYLHNALEMTSAEAEVRMNSLRLEKSTKLRKYQKIGDHWL